MIFVRFTYLLFFFFKQKTAYEISLGLVGSGKTRLLHALRDAGAQVLDLEGLASHRASVLGLIPGQPQPSQKRFEMLVWEQLRAFDAARPVYVEAESKKVGNCTVPDALMQAMRASPCLRVDLPDHERVALLLEDYPFFVSDPAFFCQRPVSCQSSAGWTIGIRSSMAPARSISSLTIRSIFFKERRPIGM